MEVKQNSIKAWFLATRPKTLTGALIPIIIASSLASHNLHCNYTAIIICFVFAGLMQIAANLINDLFDFLKGTDGAERLGPERACAQGWITPKAMRIGIRIVLALALLVGSTILLFSSWWLIAVGVVCVIFAFLYTTILSYTGLGDVLVLVFFGFVPCCGTYYVATGALSASCLLAGLTSGILIDTLLIINNYRDHQTDKKNNKITLIVLGGEKFGQYFYLFCGIAAWTLCFGFVALGYDWHALLPTLYLIPHFVTWRKMVKINQGKALNKILGETSRNMLLFGILLSLGLFLSGYSN